MAGDISRGMKRRVLLRVGDPDARSMNEEQVYAWLSEASLDIVGRCPETTLPEVCATYSWGETTSLPLVDDISDYDLPDDFLWDRCASYTLNNVLSNLTRLNIEQTRSRGSGTPAGTATDGYYWIWGKEIHIDVGSVSALGLLRLFYVKHTPVYVLTTSTSGDASEMSASTGAISDEDDPLISPWYFPAVEDFAVSRCMECRGFYSYAEYLMQSYEQRIASITARIRAQQMPGLEGKPGA